MEGSVPEYKRNIKWLSAGLVILLGLAFIVPQFVIHDSPSVSEEEVTCAQKDAQNFFKGSFEGSLTTKMAVVKKIDRKIYVNAYTLFGVKYATLEVICNQSVQKVFCNVDSNYLDGCS